jgi:hypothetical protein
MIEFKALVLVGMCCTTEAIPPRPFLMGACCFFEIGPLLDLKPPPYIDGDDK